MKTIVRDLEQFAFMVESNEKTARKISHLLGDLPQQQVYEYGYPEAEELWDDISTYKAASSQLKQSLATLISTITMTGKDCSLKTE